MFDAKREAKTILSQHIEECLNGLTFTSTSEREAYEACREECAQILAGELLKREITYIQMYAISKELGRMLYEAFKGKENAHE